MPNYDCFCYVTQAGAIESGSVIIGLTEVVEPPKSPSFDNRQFGVAEAAKREILATALTALTSGYKVWVHMQASQQPPPVGSLVERLVLVK